jgi:hypothetical protein
VWRRIMKSRMKDSGRIATYRLLADADLLALILADGVTLRKESSSSYMGPCPKCGGRDRFVVKPQGSKDRGPTCWCRHCWPEPGGDAIGYIKWHDSLEFIGACEVLARHNGHDLNHYRSGQEGSSPKVSGSNGRAPRGEPEREHIYRDADGERVLLVRIYRRPDGSKDVPQYVPDGRGGWRKSAGDKWPNGRPLYRLPELLAADPDEPVYICEGEQCADDLAALGRVATTSCMGSGKAHLTDWSPLVGRDVIILPDHDRPGFDHAEQVAARVSKAGARRVRVVPLPGYPVGDNLPDAHGRDISNWLAADA